MSNLVTGAMATTTVVAEVANVTATTLKDAVNQILTGASNETLDNSTTVLVTTTTKLVPTTTLTTTAGPR